MPERLGQWGRTVARRSRSHVLQSVAFAAVGTVVGELMQLPQWIERIDQRGLGNFLIRFLPHEMLASMTAALVAIFALRLSTERASDLVQRPRKFILILVVGTVAATGTSWMMHALLDFAASAEVALRPDEIFEFWMQALLWGGLIGWLYLLSLQYTEDRAMLDTLLGRRALLARQLASARLGSARARIDPSMVARVLGEVRGLYRYAPNQASELLDRLVGYLRLAMHRDHGMADEWSAELALIRAMVALREAEHGVAIDLRVEVGEGASHKGDSSFLTVSALLDEAIGAGARSLLLTLREDADNVRVELHAMNEPGAKPYAARQPS